VTSPETGIGKFVCPHLADFVGYSASTSPDTLAGKVEVPVEQIIKLDANENIYGCSPRVQRALAAFTDFHIYPDAGQTELRKLLQEYVGVEAEQIVAGAGSDQLIDLIFRLFVAPGDEVINCVPTFAMFNFFAKLYGAREVEVPRDEAFAVDVKAVKKAITGKTKLILLATPNNPTGTVTPRDDILEIIDTGLPVVIDEAYYEFIGQTVAPLVSEHENLMVLRTFSKWAGLAGLRVGYGIFTPRIAEYLLKIKTPYNVNMAALVAVEESLKDIDYLREKVQAVISERGRLFAELEKFAFLKPYPSQANFIFCSVVNGKAGELQKKMQDKGILVRYFDQPFLRDAIRISVGKPEHTDAVIKTLRELEGSISG